MPRGVLAGPWIPAHQGVHGRREVDAFDQRQAGQGIAQRQRRISPAHQVDEPRLLDCPVTPFQLAVRSSPNAQCDAHRVEVE